MYDTNTQGSSFDRWKVYDRNYRAYLLLIKLQTQKEKRKRVVLREPESAMTARAGVSVPFALAENEKNVYNIKNN